MKPNKAFGLDQISANFVKRLSYIITTSLCKIINHSIDCGKIPTQLKVAKVSPLYKKGSVNEFAKIIALFQFYPSSVK